MPNLRCEWKQRRQCLARSRVCVKASTVHAWQIGIESGEPDHVFEPLSECRCVGCVQPRNRSGGSVCQPRINFDKSLSVTRPDQANYSNRFRSNTKTGRRQVCLSWSQSWLPPLHWNKEPMRLQFTEHCHIHRPQCQEITSSTPPERHISLWIRRLLFFSGREQKGWGFIFPSAVIQVLRSSRYIGKHIRRWKCPCPLKSWIILF